jgi:hypothetical protein
MKPSRPLSGDTTALARQRYEQGGFGPIGSKPALKRFKHYLGLIMILKRKDNRNLLRRK